VHNCGHSEDAGVRCTGTCTQGAIRLQDGTSTEARVEICINNIWGTVCDNSWDDKDAIVACAQLGLPSSG
jgi:deleted-in-malignant-brain-tumors protein 1